MKDGEQERVSIEQRRHKTSKKKKIIALQRQNTRKKNQEEAIFVLQRRNTSEDQQKKKQVCDRKTKSRHQDQVTVPALKKKKKYYRKTKPRSPRVDRRNACEDDANQVRRNKTHQQATHQYDPQEWKDETSVRKRRGPSAEKQDPPTSDPPKQYVPQEWKEETNVRKMWTNVEQGHPPTSGPPSRRSVKTPQTVWNNKDIHPQATHQQAESDIETLKRPIIKKIRNYR
eukprot:jgi/Psemu1/52072/gm1.52072_g